MRGRPAFPCTTVECLAADVDPALCATLLANGFARGQQPVRLLGVGVRLGKERGQAWQPGLFDPL